MVRNSVDHGVESAEVRAAAGKPAEGTVAVRAFQDGGQVVIEVEDDGAGVALEKVRQKAVKLGLVTSEEAARLSEREVVDLISRPGFSTAEAVTARTPAASSRARWSRPSPPTRPASSATGSPSRP